MTSPSESRDAANRHGSGLLVLRRGRPVLSGPSLDVTFPPDTSLREIGEWSREALGVSQLVGSLARHSKEAASLGGPDKIHAPTIPEPLDNVKRLCHASLDNVKKEQTMTDKLTPTQMRKLRFIAESGETRNPGHITTTYSLVSKGLVAATKHGTYPRTHISYSITDKGRAILEAESDA